MSRTGYGKRRISEKITTQSGINCCHGDNALDSRHNKIRWTEINKVDSTPNTYMCLSTLAPHPRHLVLVLANRLRTDFKCHQNVFLFLVIILSVKCSFVLKLDFYPSRPRLPVRVRMFLCSYGKFV